MKITWKHERTAFPPELSLDQKIEVFFEQTWGWQLRVADLIANGGEPIGGGPELKKIEHSGFAVLQICLSYFEMIGQCMALGGSEACFKAGVRAVFPSLASTDDEFVDSLLHQLYVDARCGLYHSSRTRRGVGLGQPPEGAAMAYDAARRVLVISPERLPKALIRHLEAYRTQLSDSSNMAARDAFERWFDREQGEAMPPSKAMKLTNLSAAPGELEAPPRAPHGGAEGRASERGRSMRATQRQPLMSIAFGRMK